MCDPISASIALTVAGTAAQAAANNKSQKAMQGAREAERVRQKGHQDASNAVLESSMAGADKSAQDAAEGKALAERKAGVDAAVASVRAPVEATGANLAGDQTANAVINSEQAAQASKALGYAGQQGNAKAKLLSFSDLNFGNAIANARAQQDQARIANFAKGSADVLPYELENASHAGDGLKSLGSLLSTGGMVAGLGAGAGWWGNTPPPTVGTAAVGDVGRITATPAAQPGTMLNLSGVNPNLFKLPPSMVNPGFSLSTLGKAPLLSAPMPTLTPFLPYGG